MRPQDTGRLVNIALGDNPGVDHTRVGRQDQDNLSEMRAVEGTDALINSPIMQEELQQASANEVARLGLDNQQVANAMREMQNLRLETPAGGNIPAMVGEVLNIRNTLEEAHRVISESVTRVRSDAEEAITKVKASEIRLQTQQSESRHNRQEAIIIVSERHNETRQAEAVHRDFQALNALIAEHTTLSRTGVSPASITAVESKIASQVSQIANTYPEYSPLLQPVQQKNGRLDATDLATIEALNSASGSIKSRKVAEEQEMNNKQAQAERHLESAQAALPEVTYVREVTEEPARILDAMRLQYSEAHGATEAIVVEFNNLRTELSTAGFDTQEKLNLLPDTDEGLRTMIAYAEQFRASLEETTPTVGVETVNDSLIAAFVGANSNSELARELRNQQANINVSANLPIPQEAKQYIDQMRNIIRELRNPDGSPVTVTTVLETLRDYQTRSRSVSDRLGNAVRRERAIAGELMQAATLVATDTRVLDRVNSLIPRVLERHDNVINELVAARRDLGDPVQRAARMEEARENIARLQQEDISDTPGLLGRLNLAYRGRSSRRADEISQLRDRIEQLRADQAAQDDFDQLNPNAARYQQLRRP